MDARKGLGTAGAKKACLLYREHKTRDTPPPLLGERQEPFTPIIFRAKNTEKSRPAFGGKNFGKNLRENVSGGKGKPPILWERGRVVLRYERLISWAKIVNYSGLQEESSFILFSYHRALLMSCWASSLCPALIRYLKALSLQKEIVSFIPQMRIIISSVSTS